jgi:hypothetical protein
MKAVPVISTIFNQAGPLTVAVWTTVLYPLSTHTLVPVSAVDSTVTVLCTGSISFSSVVYFVWVITWVCDCSSAGC